jgi:DNA-binding NarL/FixJ family response regulator
VKTAWRRARRSRERDMQTIAVMLADDDPCFRKRVRALLEAEPGIQVVGEAAQGDEAIQKARQLAPDVVLMDVRMPGLNGLEAARQLKAERPALHVIMLTMFELDEYREAARACGVQGYIVKRSMLEELVPAIRKVAQAEHALPPAGPRRAGAGRGSR